MGEGHFVMPLAFLCVNSRVREFSEDGVVTGVRGVCRHGMCHLVPIRTHLLRLFS
jgi:hypothetical protein